MMNSLPTNGNFIPLLMLIGTVAFSQNSKTPLDKGFIEKTISFYYGKQVKMHPGHNLFFIEKDSFNMNTKTEYGTFKVQFVSKDEMAEKISKAINKTSQIDRILIKWISLDTIDVGITSCTMDVKKVNKIINGRQASTMETSLRNCVEANVEIPTCRFVYDQPTSAWAQLDDGKLVKKN
jgi:hypothetical protein